MISLTMLKSSLCSQILILIITTADLTLCKENNSQEIVVIYTRGKAAL